MDNSFNQHAFLFRNVVQTKSIIHYQLSIINY